MTRRSSACVRRGRAAWLDRDGLHVRTDRTDLAVRLLLHRSRGEHAEALACWARLRRAGWGPRLCSYLSEVSP